MGPGSGDSLCDLLRKFGRFCTNQLDSTVGRSQQKSSWTGSWGLGEQGFLGCDGQPVVECAASVGHICVRKRDARGRELHVKGLGERRGFLLRSLPRGPDLGRGSVLRIIVTVALSSPIIARDEHAHAALFACVLHILSITGMKTRPR